MQEMASKRQRDRAQDRERSASRPSETSYPFSFSSQYVTNIGDIQDAPQAVEQEQIYTPGPQARRQRCIYSDAQKLHSSHKYIVAVQPTWHQVPVTRYSVPSTSHHGGDESCLGRSTWNQTPYTQPTRIHMDACSPSSFSSTICAVTSTQKR